MTKTEENVVQMNTHALSGISEFIGHYVNLASLLFQDKPQPTPTKLQIAVVGLPRTGSGSLYQALRMLGYNPFHVDEYLEHFDLFEQLVIDRKQKITNNENKDEPLLSPMETFTTNVGKRGFDAVYYWSYDFAKWAANTDNDVKVILTVRDTPQKWAQSWNSVGKSWEPILTSKPFIWLRAVKETAIPLIKEMPNGDIETLEQQYQDHIQNIQKIVPDNKLLIFNAKQGWGPLCQFLNQPQPPISEPFPHANQRYLLQIENSMLLTITWIWPLILLIILYLLWIVFRLVAVRVGLVNDNKKSKSVQITKKKQE